MPKMKTKSGAKKRFRVRGSGTIKSGRHLKYPDNTPMNNLFLSLLDRMKVQAVSLGDSTGRVDNLG